MKTRLRQELSGRLVRCNSLKLVRETLMHFLGIGVWVLLFKVRKIELLLQGLLICQKTFRPNGLEGGYGMINRDFLP
ncbi:hypothetical protein FGO68_gene5281 [Halteria grandinella]|uniref:Uncharacterized protein n=1 Tax=Halteria grandinella TaxID=5974 RepID=A0A8J8NQW8_HALGN|nr:hypothetical protein FGO68_gene5281 [Halteria grandinella]